MYAQWKALPSSLAYRAAREDATGITPDTTGVTDQRVSVSDSGFAVTGWTFAGWNTKADGSGDAIMPGDQFTLKAEPTTVFAQWKANPAIVRYDANGGEGSTPGYEGHTGDTPDTAVNGFKPGDGCSTFVGWNTKADGTGTAYKEGTQLPALLGELTLFAQWSDVSCPASVVYDANGGTGSMDGYTGHLHDTPSAAKNGFTGKDCDTFTGWNTKADGTGLAYREGARLPELTGDLTLYAQWEHVSCPAAPLAHTGATIMIVALVGGVLVAVAAGLLAFAHMRRRK